MTREFNLAKWYRNLCAEGGGMKFNRNPHMGAGMTREEIKQIGIAAGISPHAFGLASEEAWQQVERFAALVAKAEREACAKEAENESNFDSTECGIDVANDIAAAIRARGEE